GTQYGRLSGPVSRPDLAELPARRRLSPVARTATPFDVFGIAKAGTRAIEHTKTAELNQFIHQLADVTEGNAQQVHDLVTGLARVSSALGERDGQLRHLMDQFDHLSGILRDKDQTLATLLDQSQGVLAVVARRRDDIARGLEGGATLTTQLGRLVTANEARLDFLLGTLHPVAGGLDRRAPAPYRPP